MELSYAYVIAYMIVGFVASDEVPIPISPGQNIYIQTNELEAFLEYMND